MITMAYFMKSFWKPFWIAFLGTFFGGVAVFLFVRYVAKERFLKYYGDSVLYKMFVEEVKENPWTISSISNVLLLPHSIKNCVLPLTELTFI